MSLSGFRAVDDRRRRHLVLDTERTDGDDVAARDAANETDRTGPEETRLSIDVARFVPQRLWQYYSVSAASFVGLSGLLAGWLLAEESASSGSVIGDAVVPASERLLRGTGAAMWWLAGQLCCVAWWVRSRSRVDYSGRFHAWGWSAAGFCTAAMLGLTGAHQLAAQVLAWSYGGAAAMNSVAPHAVWLLPSLVVGLVMWSTLGAELRDCWQSRALHALATVSALSWLGVELWSLRTGHSLWTDFIGRALLSLLQWSNLMTVLWHVRHVVHVTTDPAAERPSAFLWTWQRGPARWLKSLFRSLPTLPPEKNSTGDDATDELSAGNALANQRHIRKESGDGHSQDLRLDDAQPAAKGPSRRSKQASRR